MTRVFVGTSGFSYDEWRERFYPKALPSAGMLGFYGSRLDTVELNNTFYRMPTKEAFERWAAQVPAGFRFAVKASRYLSHALKLDRGAAFDAFALGVRALGDRLGPVMLQIPAPVKKDVVRLRELLATAPRGVKLAIDFRNPSWLADDTYAALRYANVALCVTDDEGPGAGAGAGHGPPVVTADFAYVRLRRDVYGRARLVTWAEHLASLGCDETYVYFKHEGSTRGPEYALGLRAALARAAPSSPPTSSPMSPTSRTGARRSASRPPKR